jgi:hypothetical protein
MPTRRSNGKEVKCSERTKLILPEKQELASALITLPAKVFLEAQYGALDTLVSKKFLLEYRIVGCMILGLSGMFAGIALKLNNIPKRVKWAPAWRFREDLLTLI